MKYSINQLVLDIEFQDGQKSGGMADTRCVSWKGKNGVQGGTDRCREFLWLEGMTNTEPLEDMW